jgi:predicted kinase
MLVVMSGLHGTGKSAIAKAFVAKYSAAYVRIDEIENAVKSPHPDNEVGPLGYVVGFAIARSNLHIGESGRRQ